MFTITELRSAVEEAGFMVVPDPDELCVLYGGDGGGAYVEVELAIVNDAVVASLTSGGLPLDAAERSQARRWFAAHEIDVNIERDDEGDTVFVLVAGVELPRLDDMAGWLDETASSAAEVFEDLALHLDTPDDELAFLQVAINLHQSGHPLEALAELERLAGDRAGRSGRAHGGCLAMLGDLLCQLDRTAEAVPLLTEAIALLAAAGEEQLAAITEVTLVGADRAAGRYAEGLARCERLTEVLQRVGGPDDLDWVELLRGQTLLAMDEYDDATKLLGPLEARLSARPKPSPHLATARLALGMCLAAIGSADDSVSMLDAAETLFEDTHQVLDVGRCLVNKAGALVKAQRMPETMEVVTKARAILEPLRTQEQLNALDIIEAEVLRARGELQRAEEVMGPAGDIGPAHDADQSLSALAQVNLGVIAYHAQDYPAAIAKLERAVARLGQLGLRVELARARHNLMLARVAQFLTAGKPDHASATRLLDEAMATVRMIEDARPDFAAVANRGRWAAQTSQIFLLAANLLQGLGRHREVVDLLERVRAQGLPDLDATEIAPGADPPGGGDDKIDGGADSPAPPGAAGPDVLSEAPSPADDGSTLATVRAALSDLRVASPQPCDVATATHAVGGPFAWRWVLWQAGPAILWGLVDGDGRAHSGLFALDGPQQDISFLPGPWQKVIGELEPLRPELDRLGRAQGLGIAEAAMRSFAVQRGALVEDPDDEEPGLAWELGRKLVPPALAEELRRRLARGAEPLPLVIAPSPGLARVAFGLLGIDAPSNERPMGRRLLEAAVVTMAPPSGLVVERARTRRRHPPPLTVRVAVVNPTGDLKHTVPLPDGAGIASCTRDGLLDTLRAVAPGEGGVMWWDGHAEAGEPGRPLGARWPLTRHPDGRLDQALSVEDLLLEGVHVPSRAVLFGCTTLGVDEGLAEWWGFPVALMYAGASSVAASTWDLFDCPASAAFATEVLQRATHADDLATGLREVQLRWLHAWQERRQDDRALRLDLDDRHPHLWAGWTVVGLHYG